MVAFNLFEDVYNYLPELEQLEISIYEFEKEMDEEEKTKVMFQLPCIKKINELTKEIEELQSELSNITDKWHNSERKKEPCGEWALTFSLQ